jgi:capsular polysaccharide biosynthesis protein
MKNLRRYINWLLGPDSPDVFIRLLQAWRLWVVGAILGALLAGFAYGFSTPDYRARATVLVDNNLEQAWQNSSDRVLFSFLARETRKLEEIAWADETLGKVDELVGGTSVLELRSGKLILSQPAEGGWHFWAQDTDPQIAESLAKAWAQAFIESVHQAVEISADLEAARAALNAAYLEEDEPAPETISALTDQIIILGEQLSGVSVYLEVSLTQGSQLPVTRVPQQGVFLLIGSFLGVLALSVAALFVMNNDPNELVVD